MADDEKSDDTIELINQLFEFNKHYFLEDLPLSDKETLIKNGVTKILKEMITGMDAAFSDVHFNGFWGKPCYWGCGYNDGMLLVEHYDKNYSTQDKDWDDLYDLEPTNEHLHTTDLKDLLFKIEYYLERRCNLGCKHRTKRFRYFSMSKLIEMVSHHRLGMPAKQIVKTYLPDFFYDIDTGKSNPLKRGRPRKINPDSSQASDLSPHA